MSLWYFQGNGNGKTDATGWLPLKQSTEGRTCTVLYLSEALAVAGTRAAASQIASPDSFPSPRAATWLDRGDLGLRVAYLPRSKWGALDAIAVTF
jgi:hypothetical protein